MYHEMVLVFEEFNIEQHNNEFKYLKQFASL